MRKFRVAQIPTSRAVKYNCSNFECNFGIKYEFKKISPTDTCSSHLQVSSRNVIPLKITFKLFINLQNI